MTDETLLLINCGAFFVHDVVELGRLTPTRQAGFLKSLSLFQAIAPSAYTLRPHFEDELVRIPTSIPDDEMLYDRLRITDQVELGNLWCEVMSRVYDLSGIYTLNLHPERGVLCQRALDRLLAYFAGAATSSLVGLPA